MSRCWLRWAGECSGRYDLAHIGLSESFLTTSPNGPKLSKDEANDPRLLRAVCRTHHTRLDTGSLSLHREQIPESVWEFAREKDPKCVAELNRRYPVTKSGPKSG